MWGLFKTQISQNLLKPKYLTKRQEPKNPIRWRLGMGTLNTRAKFQGLTLKNGVDVGIWRNFGFYAWTSLYTCIKNGSCLSVEPKKTRDSINQQQVLPSGPILWKHAIHRVDHEVTRKADSNISNIVIRHRFHLVPVPFPFLGLPLEGTVATFLLASVRTAAVALLLWENLYVRPPTYQVPSREHDTIRHGETESKNSTSHQQQTISKHAKQHSSTAAAVHALATSRHITLRS